MQSIRVPSASCWMRYHDLPGGDPPILFVHGLGCAGSCDYPRVASGPALAGRRVLLPDLLGFGFSDRPADFSYSVEDQARTLAELVEDLSLSQVDLFGHSMGGAIAIALASMVPEKIRRLALSEPNLDPGGGVFSRPIARQSEEEYVARGHAKAVEEAIGEGHVIWGGSLAVSSAVAVHRASTSLVRGSSPSWREQLERLPMPRAMIFGEDSLPDPDVERMPRAGITVRIVPKAGHSMAWENPSGLAQAIRDAFS